MDKRSKMVMDKRSKMVMVQVAAFFRAMRYLSTPTFYGVRMELDSAAYLCRASGMVSRKKGLGR